MALLPLQPAASPRIAACCTTLCECCTAGDAVQVGTSVVTRDKDQRLALGRLGALVESLEHLVRTGKQVILVTSGATAVGRQKLRFQQVLNSSPLEMQMLGLSSLQARAAAAAGQSGLMALYDSLFQMMDMQCSQFLVTSRDFKNDDFKKNLNLTVDNLLRMNVVPVINENDSISSSVRLSRCMCHCGCCHRPLQPARCAGAVCMMRLRHTTASECPGIHILPGI